MQGGRDDDFDDEEGSDYTDEEDYEDEDDDDTPTPATTIQQRVTSATRTPSAGRSTVVKNQPFDEVIETLDDGTDSESVPSEDGSPRMEQPRITTNVEPMKAAAKSR